MDPGMDKLRKSLIEIEIEAEELLLARHQVDFILPWNNVEAFLPKVLLLMVENDKVRNATREALTALRKRAKTTKSSIPSPFEAIMREMEGSTSRPLVKEVCLSCGSHDSKENTWMMFPSSDIFVRVPFHAAHTILEKEQERLDYEMKKLQSCVKEKSFIISEKGALADRVSPGIVRSMVALADRPQ